MKCLLEPEAEIPAANLASVAVTAPRCSLNVATLARRIHTDRANPAHDGTQPTDYSLGEGDPQSLPRESHFRESMTVGTGRARWNPRHRNQECQSCHQCSLTHPITSL